MHGCPPDCYSYDEMTERRAQAPKTQVLKTQAHPRCFGIPHSHQIRFRVLLRQSSSAILGFFLFACVHLDNVDTARERAGINHTPGHQLHSHLARGHFQLLQVVSVPSILRQFVLQTWQRQNDFSTRLTTDNSLLSVSRVEKSPPGG